MSIVDAKEGFKELQVAGDVLIFGESDEVDRARVNHGINLRNLLQQCRDTGIKLNKHQMKLTHYIPVS